MPMSMPVEPEHGPVLVYVVGRALRRDDDQT